MVTEWLAPAVTGPAGRKAGVVYNTEIAGRPIRLSENEAEVKGKFARLTRPALPGNSSPAREVCDECLEQVQKNRTAKTYRTCANLLNPFCRQSGGVVVAELARRHPVVGRGADMEPEYPGECRRDPEGLFPPGSRGESVPADPFASRNKTGELKRERVLTAQEWQAVVAAAMGPSRAFPWAVRLSVGGDGRSRRRLRGDPAAQSPGEKTKGPRIVWLSPGLLALTKMRPAYGEGCLFRDAADGPWPEGSGGQRLRPPAAAAGSRAGGGVLLAPAHTRHRSPGEARRGDVATWRRWRNCSGTKG